MEFKGWMIDFLLIAILVISIINGRRKGFIAAVLTFAASLIGFFIAKEYSDAAAQWLTENVIHPRLTEFISAKITESISSGAASVQALPEWLSLLSNGGGFSVSDAFSGAASSIDIDAVSGSIASAAEKFSAPLLSSVSFALIFAVFKFVSGIIISLIVPLFKLPIIGGINKNLGGIIGALKGAVIVFILCLIINACGGLFAGTAQGDAIKNAMLPGAVGDITASLTANN